MLYGAGKYSYELADWKAQFPDGWTPIEVNSLAIDSRDRLYAFNTGEYPVTVFDRDGKLLSTWGQGYFEHNHGAIVGPDDTIYYADDGNHTVSKLTLDGQPLMALGTKGQPSETGFSWLNEAGEKRDFFEALFSTKWGGPPFNAPTDVALSASGEMYISDGYGNARIHKFTPDGKLLFSWGGPGEGPGQFVVPHSVATDKRGRVLVADRHNNRIQVFDPDGNYLTEWTGLDLPTNIFIDKDETVYITELHPRLSIYDIEGNLLTQFGNEGRTEADPLFVALHSVAVDSRGDLYVAEVMGLHQGTPFLETRKTRMIQKFIRK